MPNLRMLPRIIRELGGCLGFIVAKKAVSGAPRLLVYFTIPS